MRYFVPELALGVALAPQTAYQDKFGGLPWGLPPERWPICAKCGKPQTFLAQLRHDTERLDLGAEGRCVLVFQCASKPGTCDTWKAGSGANAVLFLDAGDMVAGLTSPPAPDVWEENEVRVVFWGAHDDGIPAERYSFFFEEPDYLTLDDQTMALLRLPYSSTKIGSVPSFVQSASEAPAHPFRFVAQFDAFHEVRGEAPSKWRLASRTPDGSGFYIAAANYGDMGTGYLFIDTSQETPAGLFFWQCS
jgi:hypothetical protein